MDALNSYVAASGLVVNLSKSALYTGGHVQQALIQQAYAFEFKLEALPVRYLGLPLTTKSMTRSDYEHLVDRIRSRFLSWKNKSLSYAGRIQLIKSVIASTANFWCSVFRLPQRCLDQIESMCSAFLWSGSTHIYTKSKVSWDIVTRPVHEGGLGIRKLRDTSQVFSLNLIWRLLSNSGSLWVAWVNQFLLKQQSFWDVKITNKGSWIWRKLLKLRVVAKPFVRKEVRDGLSTYFWFDHWSELGSLFNIVGESGRRKLGLSRFASVAEAANSTGWTFRRSRDVNIGSITQHIERLEPPSSALGPDIITWKINANE